MKAKDTKNKQEFAYSIRIPKDRVAVLIGTKGAEKRKLSQLTGCDIDIDSKEGVVVVSGSEALGLYVCREIVMAIGRGFAPHIAQLLLKQDYGIELLSIKDFAKNENEMLRLKGRVIGEDGKSRRTLEELTGVHITIYGKTIGLIGELEMLPFARKAVESLLSGQKHASVYSWLETHGKEIRKRQFIGEEWPKTQSQ